MPNGDPRDGFFYPTLTLMIDSYILSQGKISDILIRCAKIKVSFTEESDQCSTNARFTYLIMDFVRVDECRICFRYIMLTRLDQTYVT